jgi:glutaredoxin
LCRNFYIIEELVSNKHCEVDFDAFLHTLQISKEDYIKAVRISISSPQVFLKRTPAETRVNSYNNLLSAGEQTWTSNRRLLMPLWLLAM